MPPAGAYAGQEKQKPLPDRGVCKVGEPSGTERNLAVKGPASLGARCPLPSP